MFLDGFWTGNKRRKERGFPGFLSRRIAVAVYSLSRVQFSTTQRTQTVACRLLCHTNTWNDVSDVGMRVLAGGELWGQSRWKWPWSHQAAGLKVEEKQEQGGLWTEGGRDHALPREPRSTRPAHTAAGAHGHTSGLWPHCQRTIDASCFKLLSS